MEAFTIFKNDYKEKDSQPDYTVSTNTGTKENPVYEDWGACWTKEGKNGKFISCSKSKPQADKPKSEDIDF